MVDARQRVFAPGDGAVPPALTGREAEKAVLRQCVGDLLRGASPPHNVVLIGPRGNGKTALLNWLEEICRAARITVVRLVPSTVRNEQALTNLLLAATGLRRFLPTKWGMAGIAKAEWGTAQTPAYDLVERLAARCRKRPTAVLVDEAHTLNREVGNVLLNASQTVRAQGAFLLVLAGTPGLLAHLRTKDASFSDRLGKGLLGIGRLDDDATREALEKPLAVSGVQVERDAMCTVVQHSQRYPFFVQLWGEALWDSHLASGSSRLTVADVAAAHSAVSTRMAEYCRSRYMELEAEGLLPAATAVARLFAGNDRVEADATASDQDLDDALAAISDDGRARLAARESLNRLGYVWDPPGQLPPILWQAGIPSLMTYVFDRAVPTERSSA